MKLESLLYQHFGYRSFRKGQKETIQSVLNGHHTLSMLATGTGKSICYQLPVYIMNKPALIVSPLVSLMQDQVEQLKMNGEKRVIAINSFLSQEEKNEALRNIYKYKFIFLSPEMLTIPHVLSVLKKISLGLFVVDEAHCISQWGYDFRPDYLRLGEVRKQLNNPLTLALTATATKEVRQDIRHFLEIDDLHEIVTSVNRSNIAIFTETFPTYETKEHRLVELVQNLKKPGIIYFLSKKAAELASEVLRANGIQGVGIYHAGMDQEQRVLIQQQFLQNQLQVICATSAFGMGINKENVRFVIHFHMPTSLETYLQEIGRSGRDGEKSVAILLYCHGDESLPLFLLESENPSEEQIRALFENLNNHYGNMLEDISVKELQGKMNLLGFPEKQERLLLHYFGQSNGSMKEAFFRLNSHIQAGKEKKLIQWQSFYRWLFQENCYRKGILQYFQENTVVNNEPCCSNCNFKIDYYYRSEDDDDPNMSNICHLDWKKELSAFLLLKDVDQYEE